MDPGAVERQRGGFCFCMADMAEAGLRSAVSEAGSLRQRTNVLCCLSLARLLLVRAGSTRAARASAAAMLLLLQQFETGWEWESRALYRAWERWGGEREPRHDTRLEPERRENIRIGEGEGRHANVRM